MGMPKPDPEWPEKPASMLWSSCHLTHPAASGAHIEMPVLVEGGRAPEHRGRRSLCTLTRYTAVPISLPIPAVTAIAAAPQNATRKVALNTGASPVRAPIAPSIARNSNDAVDTLTIIGWPIRDSQAAASGSDAPVVKVSAEVKAA